MRRGAPGCRLRPGVYNPARSVINIATEYSFDVVSRVNMAEVTNAVHQSTREVQTRFDFRGSKATIDLDAKNSVITLTAEDD